MIKRQPEVTMEKEDQCSSAQCELQHGDLAEQSRLQRMLVEIVQGTSIPTFVIDRNHAVIHWNKALEKISGIPASAMIGTRRHWSAFYPSERPCMADLILDGALETEVARLYGKKGQRSAMLKDSYEAEGFFPHMGEGGTWLFFTAAPLRDEHGSVLGAIETLQDITAKKRAEEELKSYKDRLELLVQERTAELTHANAELRSINRELEEAHHQLLQSEKMASIGQLAAGVAHEINNPIGFVNSNLGTLEGYVKSLVRMLEVYERHEPILMANERIAREIEATKRDLDLEFLKEDVVQLLAESKDGLGRVTKIVRDLKEFSHVGETQWQYVDLHSGLDSTLNIVNNELKYKAHVVREYGKLPPVECLPSELNQVFMNILVNAGHAIETKGTITVRTGQEGENAWVEIADTGAGIPPENLNRIFDPFFTTKAVGKGTGLGLSLSYGIINKHHGRIEVSSELGKGTTFRITLPIAQPDKEI